MFRCFFCIDFFFFCRINDHFALQGKLGLALLKLEASDKPAWKVILYQTQEKILSQTILESSKVFTFRNYLEFVDDLKATWRVIFSKIQIANEFVEQLRDKCTVRVEAEEIVETIKLKEDSVDNKSDTSDDKSDISTEREILKTKMSKIGVPIMASSPPIQMGYHQNNQHVIPGPTHPTGPAIIYPRPNNVFSNQIMGDIHGASAFINENRMQNSEMRMNMSKIEFKIDRILDKVDLLTLTRPKGNDLEDQILNLEEKMVDLKKENRMERESRTKEVADANKEIEKLKEELASKTKSAEKLENEIAQLKNAPSSGQTNKGKDKQTIQELTEQNKQLQTTVQSKDAEIAQLKQSQATAKGKEDSSNGQQVNNEKIQSIMNGVYGKLYQAVSTRDSMTSGEVLNIVADLIRRETKALLTPSQN